MSNGHTDPDPIAEKRTAAEEATGNIKSGIATEFWLELKPYGGDGIQSLWLLVEGKWCHLDKPEQHVQSSVQSAFCQCANYLEVAVWYEETSELYNYSIVGLVVRSRPRPRP